MSEPSVAVQVLFNCRLPGTFAFRPSPVVNDNGRQRMATRQEAFCGGCTLRYRVSPCPHRPTAHNGTKWGGRLSPEPKRTYQRRFSERDCAEHVARLWLKTVRPPRYKDFQNKQPGYSVVRRRLGNMAYIRAAGLRVIEEQGRTDEIEVEDNWECLICGEPCVTSAGLNSHQRWHKREDGRAR